MGGCVDGVRAACHMFQTVVLAVTLTTAVVTNAAPPTITEIAGEQTVLASFAEAPQALPPIGPERCDPWVVPSSGLWDNADVFLGLDGSKQPQDFGINAQFGGRASVNIGIPLVEDWNLGLQIGTAIDATADAVQVMQRTTGTSGRTQSYSTVGVFQRYESGFSWGAAYDFLYEQYYDQFTLGQWRINIGYSVTEQSTVGVWSAISDRDSQGDYAGTPVTLVPISQINPYYRYEWWNGIQTTGWIGWSDQHGQVNGVLGDLPPLYNNFVFGAELYIPLTERLAIFGQGNFITPSDSGTVDSYLGLVYYPGGGTRRTYRSAFRPWQSVAAPTNFANDLRR